MKYILSLVLFFILTICNAQSPENILWEYSYKDFFELDRLDSIIDLNNFDTNLLSCAIFHATNRIRDSKGIPLLKYDNLLYEASKLHTLEMINRNFVNHNNPKKKKLKRLIDRIYYLGGTWDEYKRFGENIIYRTLLNHPETKIKLKIEKADTDIKYYSNTKSGTIEQLEVSSYRELVNNIMNGWMKSRKHRKNLLHKKFNALGCYCLLDKRTLNKNKLPPMIKATQVFGQKR